MRLVTLLAVFAAHSLTLALSARALEPSPSEWRVAERSALHQVVLSELRARTLLRSQAKGETTGWLSELAGFYGAPDAKLLWVDERGLTAAGARLANELLRAAEWGLDPSRFDIPDLIVSDSSPEALATIEVRLSLAAMRYAFDARGGRVNPRELSLWLDQPAREPIYVYETLSKISSAGDPAEALRALHPHHPGFEQLRQAYLAARGLVDAPAASPRIAYEGPRLVRGMRHPDVVLVRDILGVKSVRSEDADLADADLMDRVHDFMYDRGYRGKFAIDYDTRRELNNRVPGLKGLSRKEILDKYLVNLERWRWMPEDMGQLHVWNNLPEFLSRVVRDGRVIHEERIIIGKAQTQTPVFSDEMSHLIFNPEWGMPESIKIRQLLGSLRGGDSGVIERRGLKVLDVNGKPISSRRINWSKTNIRDVNIVQGAGPGNPLGRLKFVFPNAHDVYMHDTPDKYLFDSSERTFSHGCMRLRNPARYAEVILAESKGWTPADVKRLLSDKATVKIYLDQHVPVHVTYFTMTADAEGNVSSFRDVYGHDRRILDALTGTRTVAQIAAADPARAQIKANQELTKSGGTAAEGSRKRLSLRVAVASFVARPGFATPKKPLPPPVLKRSPAPGPSRGSFFMTFQ